MSGVGFTREELTEAAARQHGATAPTKAEILAAIAAVDTSQLPAGPGMTPAYRAVEKLFTDRGL